MKIVALLFAALLAMAAAQSLTPSPSRSPLASTSGSPAASPSGAASSGGSGSSQFTNCNTQLLNGTGNYDLLLLGAAASASSSPSASGSPAASASAAASRSPAASGSAAASPSLANASPSFSNSPAASPAASSSAVPSVAISPAANARLLDLSNSLVGGRTAVNGDARIVNSILGAGLNCATSSASSSPAASSSALISASPATSSAAISGSPSASISSSPLVAASGSPLFASGSPAASPSSSAAASPAASSSPSSTSTTSSGLSLLVAGNLQINNAQLACGGLGVGGQLTGSPLLAQQNAQNLTGQQALTSSNLDLSTLRQRMLTLSDELCALPSTLNVSINSGVGVLDASRSSAGSAATTSATSSNVNNVVIVNVPSSALDNLTSILINGTSANTFIIVNILDQSSSAGSAGAAGATSGAASSGSANLTLSGFRTDLGSLNASNLLWNFCNATRINVDSLLLFGTLLAPRAAFTVTRSELEGALIADSLTAQSFNHIPLRFQGNFCPAASASPAASPAASPSAAASPAASAAASPAA